MKIKHVSQLDNNGCGLACVAMLTGKTYEQVKQRMIEQRIFEAGTEDFGTTFNDIRQILDHYQITTSSKRKFKKWGNIPAKVAIASTNYDKNGGWHWIVFVRDIDGHFVYDPALRRKKIRDMRGKGLGYFIEIL